MRGIHAPACRIHQLRRHLGGILGGRAKVTQSFSSPKRAFTQIAYEYASYRGPDSTFSESKTASLTQKLV
jgi:hypothetical protein